MEMMEAPRVDAPLGSPAPREFEIRYHTDLLWRRRGLLLAAALGGLALGVLAAEL